MRPEGRGQAGVGERRPYRRCCGRRVVGASSRGACALGNAKIAESGRNVHTESRLTCQLLRWLCVLLFLFLRCVNGWAGKLDSFEKDATKRK